MSSFEFRHNPELKKTNIKKIIAAGGVAAAYPQFGADVMNVGQLTLNNGNIIPNSNLIFNLGADGGEIILSDGSRIAQFEYIPQTHDDMLFLQTSARVYKGEGSGFGFSLVQLGSTTLNGVARLMEGYSRIYAVGEDTAHNTEPGNKRDGWSGDVLKSMGYTDDKATLKSLGLLYNTRKMFVKRLA